MTTLRPLLVAALAILFSLSARADEIDNPQFSAWSSFNVGTRVTLESKMSDGMTMTSVRTLKQKADDHIVIEVLTTLEKGGKKEPSRPIPVTVKAKVDKAEAKELEHEKIKAAGKTYDCTIFAMEDAAPNYIGTKPKIWVSPQVPGGIVKVEMSTPVGTNTQMLKSIAIKK